MTKLAGITLTVVLALLGTVGWIVSPAYEMSYHPDLPDHRTLRFTPNDLGGYDIEEIPFTFEPTEGSYYDLGNGPLELHLSEQPLNACSTALNFEFPFYEQTYSELYVCNDGTLSMGQPILYRDYQYRYGTGIPLIMALLTDLYPEISSGGVFVLQNSERLIVTWDHLRGFRQTEAVFTFQLTLYHSGIFVISYNGLPPAGSPLLTYRPNDDPGESVWAIGAVPGGRSGYTPQEATLADLPLRSGPGGVVQDYRLEFRQYLNVLFVPLAWMILAVCAFILICLPLFLYFNLVQPLRNLLTGVKQVNSGQLDVRVPIQYNDEIGDLTGSFNKMAGELCSLVGDLEAHVTARTSELAAANEQLLTEISDRETAQAQVLQRQRELAMLEERESLGRDLHDDLGQAIASISVQVQAAQTLISAGQDEAAQINLEQVKQLAQDANASIRNYILGLQEPPTSPQNLVVALRASLRVFSENTGSNVP